MCFSSCSLFVSSLLGMALLPGICFSIAGVLGYLVWPRLHVAVFLWVWSFLPSRIIPAGFSAGMTWPPLTDLTLCQHCCLNIIPFHPHCFPRKDRLIFYTDNEPDWWISTRQPLKYCLPSTLITLWQRTTFRRKKKDWLRAYFQKLTSCCVERALWITRSSASDSIYSSEFPGVLEFILHPSSL